MIGYYFYFVKFDYQNDGGIYMIKELKKISKLGKKGSLFVGGVLFGTAG